MHQGDGSEKSAKYKTFLHYPTLLRSSYRGSLCNYANAPYRRDVDVHGSRYTRHIRGVLKGLDFQKFQIFVIEFFSC